MRIAQLLRNPLGHPARYMYMKPVASRRGDLPCILYADVMDWGRKNLPTNDVIIFPPLAMVAIPNRFPFQIHRVPLNNMARI